MNRVELSLAADTQMLLLARMTGAAVAVRADFDYEQVEDLRLAIDELCVQLMGHSTGLGRITLLFQWDDTVLDVVGTWTGEDAPSSNASTESSDTATKPSPVSGLSYELSERILEALVDDYGSDAIGGVRRAWLRMKRRERLG